MAAFHPLVTCVVPVYNAAKYLNQTVGSLLSQTYENCEIILVDDHSTDDSLTICKRFAAEYPAVRVFQNETNSGGPLRGRERGIFESKGEWVTFIDCDDYVAPEYVQHLLEATREGTYDIAVTGYSRVHADGVIEPFIWPDYAQTSDERLTVFYEHFLHGDFWTDPTDTVGQNLIRASVCKSTDLTRYSGTVYAEDTLMALAFIANSANGVNFVDHHDFFWRQIDGSGSHGGFSETANKQEFFAACKDIFHRSDVYGRIGSLPTVSVIVPVYNVESYVQDCIDSILAQTYTNLQIILVNDGSTDGSGEVIGGITDERVRIITQDNKGLNMARSAGTDAATGEYITFIDSDDMVHEDYVRVLYENLITNGADFSAVGYVAFEELDEIPSPDTSDMTVAQQVLPDRYSILRYFLSDIESVPNVYQMTAWGKLHRLSSVKATDWRLSNYSRHEDNLETLQWYLHAGRAVISSVQLYYYRHNPASITKTVADVITPDGMKLPYFAFLRELYEKEADLLAGYELGNVVRRHFADTLRIKAYRMTNGGTLDSRNNEALLEAWDVILGSYDRALADTAGQLRTSREELGKVYQSNSWKLAQPLRRAKSALRTIRRKVR